MSYIYFNFSHNLTFVSANWDSLEIYTKPLETQYKKLLPIIGDTAKQTLREFLADLLPANKLFTFHVSVPSFKRERRESKNVCNMVVRVEDNFNLPQNHDLILIGDLIFDKTVEFVVKGVDLLDKNIVKYGEVDIQCYAACCFEQKQFQKNGIRGPREFVPQYNVYDLDHPAFTEELAARLRDEIFPVPNPDKALTAFKQWQDYLSFRKYYLERQTAQEQPVDNVEVISCHKLPKSIFNEHKSEYEKWQIPLKRTTDNDNVLLWKKVDGAEGITVVKVEVVKSNGEFADSKNAQKFEAKLKSFTRTQLLLKCRLPDDEEDWEKSYQMGDRFAFEHTTEDPDISGLQKNYDEGLEQQYAHIEEKYEGIKKNELAKELSKRREELVAQSEEKIQQLALNIERDVEAQIAQGNDPYIKNKIDQQASKLTEKDKEEFIRLQASVNAKIKGLKKSKATASAKNIQLQALRKQLDDAQKAYNRKFEEAKASVNVKALYAERNEARLQEIRKTELAAMEKTLDKFQKEQKAQLNLLYQQTILDEKTAAKEQLQKQLNEEKEWTKKQYGLHRYSVYFCPYGNLDTNELRKRLEEDAVCSLSYDGIAESTKIKRQQESLFSLMDGYVKNPYLASYLFAPEQLAQATIHTEEPEWFSPRLNEMQKEAVRKALASESLFLLQGPPGTGKTEVIAELTAQLVKRGKKVLISSETHKAIDNAFQKLPNSPLIRPLRLIPTFADKETEFSPKNLVRNFYKNLESNLTEQIVLYERYDKEYKTFWEKVATIKGAYSKVATLKVINDKIVEETNAKTALIAEATSAISRAEKNIAGWRAEIETCKKYLDAIDQLRFSEISNDHLTDFPQRLQTLLKQNHVWENVTLCNLSEILTMDAATLKKQLDSLQVSTEIEEYKATRLSLRKRLAYLRNPETDDDPQEGEDNYELFVAIKRTLPAFSTIISTLEQNVGENLLLKLVPAAAQDKALQKSLPNLLKELKAAVLNLAKEEKVSIGFALNEVGSQIENASREIAENRDKIAEAQLVLDGYMQSSEYAEYISAVADYQDLIFEFFDEHGIEQPHSETNIDEIDALISDYWQQQELRLKKDLVLDKNKIEINKRICEYLSREDVLEEDSTTITRELCRYANVYGITCSSRDKYFKKDLPELASLGIDNIDVRDVDFDTVIIDEVSKSSFLDILLPISYGKTVVLVGDHRQLPPMYDLRYLSEEDFGDFDEEEITPQRNKQFQELYEECFFKTLFEKIPSQFKVMLNRQYRCHSQIMHVFNHFYGGVESGLKLGNPETQDYDKRHNITVEINGKTILEPQSHVYFVNCTELESNENDGGTSKSNEQEANVAIRLLEEINAASKRANEQKTWTVYGKEGQLPSVGIICTYGGQARKIRRKRQEVAGKNNAFKWLAQESDEKLTISTVDDFQGDERDIIILSMVRNKTGRFDAEFVKKFERINVAMSRARTILIILGSKEFLSRLAIDLPDLNDRREFDKFDFHVYKEIISNIPEYNGKVLQARDILGGE